MSIEALQEYTRVAKYARYNKEEGRRETWAEQVNRVMDMHKVQYAGVFEDIREDWEYARTAVLKKQVLGSQRALQFGGQAILDKNERMYNCTYSYADRIRFFQEFMYLCLCGCGCGFSVQTHHIDKLPTIVQEKRSNAEIFAIEDSIEGWADAIGALVSSYFTGTEFSGKKLIFDYSLIRPANSIIHSSGAKAPGPDGLKLSIDKIVELLDSCIDAGQEKLKSINVYDVLMHCADAVVSGGIRRAATICLFSKTDDDMMKAKTGSWFIDNPQRGRSNNSVLLVRKDTNRKEFGEIMKSVQEFGEPGFVFAEDTEAGYNPCVEIGLYAHHPITGESGWEFCNLCEINMKKCKTKEEYFAACKAASILGTFQAGYANFPYLGKVTEDIVNNEALIGVSMTGMMDTPDIAFDPKLQTAGANVVKENNKRVAKLININQAARATCVKPAGTTSCILGTSSGIHPHHAKRYMRRVQANHLELPLKYFETFNPKAVAESVWDPNGVTKVVSFLCEVPKGAKTKNQINALNLLDYVKLTQQNWVAGGKTKELCAQPWLDHNVSNTINVQPTEWEEVTDFIYNNRKFFAGISLIPMSGDKDYPQAPFTTVYTPKEIVKEYGDGSLMSSGLIVHAHNAFNDNLWSACDTVLGIGEKLDPNDTLPSIIEKIKWVDRAVKFANSYFDGDVKRMTYCLKDVNNWKMWCDLQREYVDVPWDEFFEEDDNTKLSETVACAGGQCETSLEI